jgi:phospholipid-binding lipoprotein MlaA
MLRKSRICFFLFIFPLIFGCSQHAVKPEKHDYNGNVPIDSQTETSQNPIQAAPEKEVDTFSTSKDEFADNGEEFGEDEAGFDEFEDEFGGDETAEVFDPFGGYNRVMTGFNDKLYFWVLKPVAKGYRSVVPEFARRGINNFFKNLYYPVRLVNNVLQLKLKNAGEETLRFATNSTIGVLGFWDPAKAWFGLEAHPEDFGQTLGYWGVGAGPHLVLPFLGPSNLRDTFALAPSWVYLNPINNLTMADDWIDLDAIESIEETETKAGIVAFEEINYTSLHIGEYENLKKDAIDFYPFMRDLYEQNRQKEIEE